MLFILDFMINIELHYMEVLYDSVVLNGCQDIPNVTIYFCLKYNICDNIKTKHKEQKNIKKID